MILATFSLYSCENSKSNLTVQGKALNAKAGAVVETEIGIYYISGLNEWPEEFYGKQVEVTGTYSFVDHKTESTKDRQVTEMVGKQKNISNATYKIIKE